ncbi:MAG: hypothetical protein LBK61_03285 [Spirochaetaceae bacterium]|jgi:hypothetical protein|nr:hypothetical protein [Spirochaetaceae bacterium]
MDQNHLDRDRTVNYGSFYTPEWVVDMVYALLEVSLPETAVHFYTMRDINALKRTTTFTNQESGNTIRVTRETLPYYCYVGVFKDYIPHIPYYFRNSNIMINNSLFTELQDVFVSESSRKHPGMMRGIRGLRGIVEPDKRGTADSAALIERYFRTLLGEHYVESPV